MNARAAFTLVELVVVMTIIVILLTLLVPALDSAIYQAELAVCGAQVKGIATASQVYAMDHVRRYPARDGLREESAYSADTVARDRRDDRPKLRPYVSMDSLVDPLTKKVDLDIGGPGSHAADEGGHYHSSYHLFFGWRWSYPTPQRGMDRIGDRFSWDGVDASGADRLYHYRYLAADHDFIDSDGGSTHGSHPDADGVMFNMALQNEDFSSVSAAAYAATAGRKLTLSRWQSIQTSQRGSIDMNFALDDGSVERYTDVRWNEGLEHDRFTRAAEFSDGWLYPQFTIQLPTQ